MLDTPAPQPNPNTEIAYGCLTVFSTVALVALLGLVLFMRFLILPIIPLVSGAEGASINLWNDLTPLLVLFMVGLPSGLLAWFVPRPQTRAVFQMWLWAALFPVVLIPATLPASTFPQWSLVLQLLIALIFYAVLARLLRWTRPTVRLPFITALVLVSLLAYPWLVWGALGSFLDGLLILLISLVFGLTASQLLSHYWLATIEPTRPLSPWEVGVGGLVVGGMLALMGSNWGFNGSWVLSGLMLPATGWLVMVLAYRDRAGSRLSVALLIGLVAGLPLWFADTDVMIVEALALSPGEAFSWLMLAVGVTVGLAWLLGVVGYGVRLGLGDRVVPRPGKAILLTLSLLIGLTLYLVVGQPGLHGDRLFVVLKDQADVSSASEIADYDERRQFVYDTLTDHAETSQAGVRQLLDLTLTGYTPYYLVNGLEVRGGLFHRLLLSAHPDVDRVLASPVLRPLPAPFPAGEGTATLPSTPLWNLSMIEADRVWAEFGVRGEGIVVGQSDSGVAWTHPQLQAAYRGSADNHDYNWLDPWDNDPEPTDYGGHGTHTLGTVLGETVGVAPGATWFGCKNLGRNLANPALYLDCLQFMLAPTPLGGDPFTEGDPTLSAHVLNNSWGCPQEYEGCDPNALLPAVVALRAAGVFVVASAGNSGPACSTIEDAIAIYDPVFTVGAVTRSGDITDFSSVGPVTADGSDRLKPDIIAPGRDVLSAFPNNGYASFDGTSMAGPHVVGVVALIWSANPNLIGDIDRTEDILRTTATRYTGNLAVEGCDALVDTSIVPNNIAGYGIVNAYRAVELALEQE